MKLPIAKCLLMALSLAVSASLFSAVSNRPVPVIEENQGKALLVYNIAKFTEWPTEIGTGDAPFEICLWNGKELLKAFEKLEGLETQGRKVGISNHKIDTIPVDCEILIIPRSQWKLFKKQKSELNNRPILTVTTDPKIFDEGAMILIEIFEDRLAFTVNLKVIELSGLEISGNLLRHARKVNF